MKLLVAVQALDKTDPINAFLDRWIAELARRVQRLRVIAARLGPHDSPVEAVSLGKERGVSKPARIRRFFAEALAVADADAALVLQIAEMALALGPIAKARGMPLYLWYSHRTRPAALRLALPFVRRVFTSHENGMRLAGRKRAVIGQGIDTDAFAPRPGTHSDVLCVGRLSRIKDPQTLIRAAKLLKARPRVRFVGAPLTGADHALVRELDRSGVEFSGSVEPSRMPETYATAAATVNLAPTGAPDKAALEAMACGVPTLACNESLPLPPELRFRRGDAADLAARLDAVLAASPRAREELGARLRREVVARHDLKGFVSRMIGAIESDHAS